ncbi:MAG: hypothetical protein M3461_19205 [Pseudomonadota bacterium]|nr:hypothetical protein [Pseudomonadota bacterium]
MRSFCEYDTLLYTEVRHHAPERVPFRAVSRDEALGMDALGDQSPQRADQVLVVLPSATDRCSRR